MTIQTEPVKQKYPFYFIKLRKISYAFSILMVVGLFIPLVMGKNINWGIDFAGGIKIQAKLPQGVSEEKFKKAIQNLNVGALIQLVGTKDKREFLIAIGLLNDGQQRSVIDRFAGDNKAQMLQSLEKKQAIDIIALLKAAVENMVWDGVITGKIEKHENIDWQNAESVGPAVGSMLRKDGMKLFLIASFFMLLYLSFRFEFRYSIAAMVALIHDLIIISLFIAVAHIEINIPVLAALLTLLGYSINDTIVIFDRIRENSAALSKVAFMETIESAIWQSMSRSLMTSFTTLVAVIALYLFGGEALNGFSLTLLVGLIIGTYSSVFVAAPLLYDWDQFFSKFKKEKPPVMNTFSSVQ